MKVKSNTNLSEFKPIELTITIESVEELVELWHRMNLNCMIRKYSLTGSMQKYNDLVFKDCSNQNEVEIIDAASDSIFNELNKIAVKMNLK
jgi:hypothetical protein